ncbi:MAG: tRNA (guanosine(37)-N1)-methyltransferase TrmD [Pseudomonadota bacterium]
MSDHATIGVVTLFPEQVQRVGQFGVIGRAVANGEVELQCVSPRDFADDTHRTVDDRPFGGGPGMVMQYGPWVAAIRSLKAQMPDAMCVALSPQGRRFDQQTAVRAAAMPGLVLVAARYEGFDERIIEAEIDEEWSLGDFVLSGGELAAMAMIDSIIRLRPGVLGHSESAVQESFSEGLLDHPHYTRPPIVEGRAVPPVLMGGDHAEIARWRRQQALGRTWQRRPDLLEQVDLSEEDKRLLASFRTAANKQTTGE